MFVHLHVHSDYSLLYSCITIPELTRTAAASGIAELALVDIDTMAGAVEFTTACRQAGIRPIYGLELSVQHGPNQRRLVLLAENNAGYQNLLRLASQEQTPTAADLTQFRKGLLALTGSTGCGWFNDALAAGDKRAIRELYQVGLDIFGPGAWFVQLEVDAAEKRQSSEQLYNCLEAHGAEFAGSQEGCLLHAHQEIALRCMHSLQNHPTKSGSEQPRPLGRSWRPLAKPDLMVQRFSGFTGAVSNTAAIAQRCRVELTFSGTQLPSLSDHDSLFSEARRALEQRLPTSGPQYVQRLENECDVIERLGFAEYFFIVADIVRYARSQGVPVGPGRGSAAGSLTAYALGITDVDPLEYDLLFERFLNPNRQSPPDIDLDFCAQRRDAVVQYVLRRYGREYAAQIGTYGTFGVRAALRDAAKVLNVSDDILERCLKLADTMREAPRWDSLLHAVPEAEMLLRAAQGLFGRKRSLSIHAAGIVLAKQPLLSYTSMRYTAEGLGVTHMDMESLQNMGLLKIDVLGLRTLTILHRAEQWVRKHDPAFSLRALDLNDSAVYDTICSGDTFGVFQLESSLFQDVIRQLQPRDFADLTALLAVGRPGPLQFVPSLARRRRGETDSESVHPMLAAIATETHGLLIYQEQVMRAAHSIGGLSLAEADELRSAMSKKQPRLIQQYRKRFVTGAQQQGMSAAEAQTLFAHMERFGGYAFNKSHSASYARITFQCAFLKRHYPAAFFAAVLQEGDRRGLRDVLLQALRSRVKILPPDLRSGQWEAEPLGVHELRLGLGVVRGMNRQLLDRLQTSVSDGESLSLASLVQQMRVPEETLLALIKTGALDFLGERSQIWSSLQGLLAKADRTLPTAAQWAQWEQEAFGFHLVHHPAQLWREHLEPLRHAFDRVEAGMVLSLQRRDGSWRGQLYTQQGIAIFVCSERPPGMQLHQWWAVLGQDQSGAFMVESQLPLTQWLVLSPTAEQVAQAAGIAQRHRGPVPVILAFADDILHLADNQLWVDGSAELRQALIDAHIAHRFIDPYGQFRDETS